MAASTIAPMAIAMPPSDMMFDVTPVPYIGMKDRMTAIGIVRIGMIALGTVPEKNQNHQADDHELLGEGPFQSIDRTLDQIGAIIGRRLLRPLRGARA